MQHLWVPRGISGLQEWLMAAAIEYKDLTL